MKNIQFIVIALFLLSSNSGAAAALSNDFYEITPDSVNARLNVVEFDTHSIVVANKHNTQLSFKIGIEGSAKDVLQTSTDSLSIPPGQSRNFSVTAFANGLGVFNGTIKLSGDINEELPVAVSVSDKSDEENFVMKIETESNKVRAGNKLKFILVLNNMLIDKSIGINLTYALRNLGESNESAVLGAENINLNTTLPIFKEFELGERHAGDYILEIRADYEGKTSNSKTAFSVIIPLMDKRFIGIKMKYFIIASAVLLSAAAAYFNYKKRQMKKKRYKSKISLDQLPKPGPRSVVVGKIAETNITAYFDIDQLMSHTIVAGSTGGGKTVSAEVLVEEALNMGAAAIVFDPTAQWTGFLRKNTDKNMFTLYTKFGMKQEQAKAFNGNIKQILNAREIIDIKKYIKPGEITCFAINKLEPEDIDILVANIMRQVFKANLPESKELKLVIIFDEVHRLLPKFGGSGQGFVQIERGAREFRKWGVGLILISQVLTDFIGETKANIANEIQVRTRDQGDLDRIKTKYGDYMLQSLLKAATGTGMYENAAFNRGDPYFIAFRPLLHEHAAIDDEAFDNYNKYNAITDELEYNIEQLKELNVDVFDLTLELKLAKDKVKTGNFNMVNIYLESLKPRIESEWQKLGKKPKKMELRLIDEEELKSEYEKAMKDRSGEKGGEKAEGPKVSMLRLKSGIVVLNLQELEDAFNSIDDKTYSYHFDKGDFANWAKQINPALEAKLKEAKTKEEALKALKEASQQKGKEAKK